jgi:hypothetical protein
MKTSAAKSKIKEVLIRDKDYSIGKTKERRENPLLSSLTAWLMV